MIVFKKLTYKNFLAVGNNPISIDLTRHKKTLVVGHNGAGKTTMIDALSFALFGKAYRNVNKGQLVNSVNKKDLLVTCEFEIGSNLFEVRRGQKPTLFEIYKNGKLLDFDAKVVDQQKSFELDILKMNFKTFFQVVVLGSSSYVPFMKLPSAQRREVIENLLDINVFTRMNVLAKTRINELKSQMDSVKKDIDLTKEKIALKESHIASLNRLNENQQESDREKIELLQNEVDVLQSEISNLENQIANTPDLATALQNVKTKQNEFVRFQSIFEGKITIEKKAIQFFEKNDHCPTCSQTITPELKSEKTQTGNKKVSEYEEALETALEKIKIFQKSIDSVQNKIELFQNAVREKTFKQTSKRQIEAEISNLKSKTYDTADVDSVKNDLQIEQGTLNAKTNQKAAIADDAQYVVAALEMLKDNGIKTKIVEQFLPHINLLINQYLKTFDFFVSFYLDNTFTETIKSRYRDDFSYDSFSEGEKQKIDLSILMAWRGIARMKNSAATNLLIMDETFDASLDNDGIENLMKIVDQQSDKNNIFVISHKVELLEPKFEHKIIFEKDGNFTRCIQI